MVTPSGKTRWWPWSALLEAAPSVRTAVLVRAAIVVLVLWSGACQTSRSGAPARSHDDAGAGLDASAGRSELDAGGEPTDAFVDAPHDASADSADSPITNHTAPPFAPPWRRQQVELEADGRTALLTFDLGELERPVFALRTYAADPSTSARLCFQLEDVRADETSWVPTATSADYGDYCTNCGQRVAVGNGYGLFILPSGGNGPARIDTIALRVALRDCLTLTPLSRDAPRPRSLVVESVTYSAPAPQHTLELPLLIVEATPHTFTDGARLDRAFAIVQELWRPAGIELVLRGPLVLPRPPAPVKYDATNRASLVALTHELKALAQKSNLEPTTPWLALTPCLVRDDPLTGGPQQLVATTTHLPGGFGVDDEPDGIFVAGERCGGLSEGARYLDSETLASVIAHELGHYLGLFHVRELDGRQDALSDTDPDAANLMVVRPRPEATKLTESQVAIARLHLALAVSRWSLRNEFDNLFR